MIFFPNRDVAEADPVAAGVTMADARSIFSDLAYLGGFAGLVLVDQDGERLNFTTSWRQIPDVQPPETLVVSRRKTGIAEIELRRDGGAIRVRDIR